MQGQADSEPTRVTEQGCPLRPPIHIDGPTPDAGYGITDSPRIQYPAVSEVIKQVMHPPIVPRCATHSG